MLSQNVVIWLVHTTQSSTTLDSYVRDVPRVHCTFNLSFKVLLRTILPILRCVIFLEKINRVLGQPEFSSNTTSSPLVVISFRWWVFSKKNCFKYIINLHPCLFILFVICLMYRGGLGLKIKVGFVVMMCARLFTRPPKFFASRLDINKGMRGLLTTNVDQ